MLKTSARLAAAGFSILGLVAVPQLVAQSAGNDNPGAATSAQGTVIPNDQIRKVGGAVKSPEVLRKVEPIFSNEARAEKFEGVVTANLIVNTKGFPEDVHVVRGVGRGLDEAAVDAIRQYRFKPTMEKGKPVPVRVNVEVNFEIKDKRQPK